ncbi:peroxidasin [Elysia marginata]|uniref:Peroxidasin n=1 Tax=Elysia marginata TaxID=1093978 RepID=A0AAV4EBP2_9GAST|nr:peroxidasin [Elysia marginata]
MIMYCIFIPEAQVLWVFVIVILISAHLCAAEVRCFDCPGVSSPYDCSKIRRCRADEQCYIRAYVNDAYAIRYDMGCQSNGFCSVVPKRSFAQDKEILDLTYAQLALAKEYNNASMADILSGVFNVDSTGDDAEDSGETSHLIQKRQYEIPLCTKCCDKDHCNSELCPSSLITKPVGVRCYDCGLAFVTDPVLCLNVRYCGAGESCHVASQNSLFGIKYQVNCDSSNRCADQGSNTPYGKRDISERDILDPETDIIEKISKRDMIDPEIDYTEKISKRDMIDPETDYIEKISKRDMIDPETDEIEKISKRDAVQTVSRAGAVRCYTCCDTDFCNIDYCSKYRPLPGNMSTSAVTLASVTTATTMATTSAPRLSLLFVQYPEDVERELNSAPVQWVCQVDGLPAPVYRWKRLPADVDITSKASLSTDGKTSTLTFDPVTTADEGSYLCEASNQYETLNRTGKLTVWAPLVGTDPKLQPTTIVEEGTEVKLNCKHTGYPNPQYSWDINLDNGMKNTSTLTQYVIANITRDDSGTYECFVTNSRENKTLTTKVDVQYAPEFTAQLPVSMNVTEGSNFTFQCPAEGNPPPEWAFMYVDESNFPHILSNVFTTANSDALIIPKMLDTYSGSFTCFIKNSLGTKSQTVLVKVVP